MAFEPPSPGRLALKGIETDDDQTSDDAGSRYAQPDRTHRTVTIAPLPDRNASSPIDSESESETASMDRPVRPKVQNFQDDEKFQPIRNSSNPSSTHSSPRVIDRV